MAPTPFTNFGITQWISISQRVYVCELVGKLSFPGGGGAHGRSSSPKLYKIDAFPDTHDLSPKIEYPTKQSRDVRGGA